MEGYQIEVAWIFKVDLNPAAGKHAPGMKKWDQFLWNGNGFWVFVNCIQTCLSVVSEKEKKKEKKIY